MNLDVRYLNEKQVSQITGRAVKTLQNDRWLGRGISYYKLGKSVRYLLDDVIKYMEAKKVRTKIG